MLSLSYSAKRLLTVVHGAFNINNGAFNLWWPLKLPRSLNESFDQLWANVSIVDLNPLTVLMNECLNLLSGTLAKSGPLDSRPKILFLYFLFVKRVWYTCIKTTLFIFQFFIFALLQAKNQFEPKRGFRWWSKGWNLWILKGALRPIRCSLQHFA